MARNWQRWHVAYDREGDPLRERLAAVTSSLADAIASMPPGPIRLASLCAGDGRDVVAALADHPRREDVTARLVELDPVLARRAESALAGAGIAGDVLAVDAGTTEVLADVAPVDVLLLCGIFGNIAPDDVRRTIHAVPTLCRRGATVLWTRHRRPPDLTPSIREWFAEAGCVEVALHEGSGTGVRRWCAGVERLDGPAAPFTAARLFTFRDDAW